MQVAGGRQQRHRPVRHVLVSGADVGLLRRVRLVGEGEAPLAALALHRVEDGVGPQPGHVHPERMGGGELGGGGRVGRHEVDVVGDRHLRRLRRQVVDHVVHDPVVRRRVLVAVALRQLQRRLLLAGGEGRIAVVEPDAVVQVDHVDARHLAAARVDEVRLEARDEARDLGLVRVDVGLDVVLARQDVDRPVLEVQALGVGIVDVLHQLCRGHLRAGQRIRPQRAPPRSMRRRRERRSACESCTPPEPWRAANRPSVQQGASILAGSAGSATPVWYPIRAPRRPTWYESLRAAQGHLGVLRGQRRVRRTRRRHADQRPSGDRLARRLLHLRRGRSLAGQLDRRRSPTAPGPTGHGREPATTRAASTARPTPTAVIAPTSRRSRARRSRR